MLINASLRNVFREPLYSRCSMVLKPESDKFRNKYLQINIGRVECESVECFLDSIEPPRPMTHDTIKNVFSLSDTFKLEKVLIDSCEEGVFFAKMVVDVDGIQSIIDCRPSDAVAVGIRLNVPILVDDVLFEKYGVDEQN